MRVELVVCDCCGQQLELNEWVRLPFKSRLLVNGTFWYYDMCGRSCRYEFKQWVDWSGKTINRENI